MSRVTDTFDHYNIEYEEIKNSSVLLYLCPFHADTQLGSARFDEDEEIYKCFSCGDRGGHLVQFISRMEGCTVPQAIKLLENNFSLVEVYDTRALQEKLARFEITVSGAVMRHERKSMNYTFERIFAIIASKHPPLELLIEYLPLLSIIRYNCESEKELLNFYTVLLNALNERFEL